MRTTTAARRLLLVPALTLVALLLVGPLLGLHLQFLLGVQVGFAVAWVLQGIAAPRAEATFRRRVLAELTHGPTPDGFDFDGTVTPQHRITVVPQRSYLGGQAS